MIKVAKCSIVVHKQKIRICFIGKGNSMRKKSLVVLAMATTLVLGGAMTTHAEETQWYVCDVVEPYSNMHVDENLAQADAWAERHKGDIASIANIEERYAAVVNEVINFLDYDIAYVHPMMYYTIRDEKGVCGDYTLLTGALCEKVGIEHKYATGVLLSAEHPVLKININGDWRYSDPTNYESGAVGLYGVPNGWEERPEWSIDKKGVASGCGMERGDLQFAPAGMTYVTGIDGNKYLISNVDLSRAENGEITFAELFDQYGVPHK